MIDIDDIGDARMIVSPSKCVILDSWNKAFIYIKEKCARLLHP
jgi:hypothetical protein